MNLRAYLLAALLVSPAWCQEPAAETPAPAARPFDFRGDVVKKIVRDTAATQFADVRVVDEAPANPKPQEVVYVPPEKPAKPARKPARQPPASAQVPDGFVSTMVGLLVDEVLGDDKYDEVTFRNDMLRCRVQKETKTSPPGVDNCPSVD